MLLYLNFGSPMPHSHNTIIVINNIHAQLLIILMLSWL